MKNPASNRKTPGQSIVAGAFVITAIGSLIIAWASFSGFLESWEYRSGRSILWALPRVSPFLVAFGASLLGVRYALQGSRRVVYMAIVVVGIGLILGGLLIYALVSQGGSGWH